MHEGSPRQEIDQQERGILLSLARESIRCRLAGEPAPSPESVGGVLIESRGAFVTLKIDGRLRGCIGHVVGVEPLWKAVRSNAVAAAFDDPRFEPLRSDELDEAQIEISALSPLRGVDADDVVVGRDGSPTVSARANAPGVMMAADGVGWIDSRRTVVAR
ncbi:MAG: AmmeMemoRadiSam system protein A [Acidobacteriota bacterium]